VRARLLIIGVLTLAALLADTSAEGARHARAGTWQRWHTLHGVVDIVGPRADGRFVVAARGTLFLVRPANGRISPYPVSTTAYNANPKLEPYIAVAGPRQRVSTADCTFPRNTVYTIEPAGRTGVLSITASGKVRRLAALQGVTTLDGIVFDSGGSFGGRLLVVGLTAKGRGVLMTIDCRGRSRTLTRTAPHMEGGLVIAPPGFGALAGDLLAPDEVDGLLLALTPAGQVSDVVDLKEPAGGDIGVESLGVVPAGPEDAYLSDRRSPGNRHPGHDVILRLSHASLRAAGVAPGDVLAALEGGATTVDVRCAPTCRVRPVAKGPTGAHAEGSIAFAR
jgi:hypothetical protein